MKKIILLSVVLGNFAVAGDGVGDVGSGIAGIKNSALCKNTMKELDALLHEQAVQVADIATSENMEQVKKYATISAQSLDELSAVVESCTK